MRTSSPEALLEEWAAAWTSGDIERVTELLTDDCLYEDVAMGAVNRGKDEIRTLAGGAVLAATPSVRIRLSSRFVDGHRGAMEWVLSGGGQIDTMRLPGPGKAFSIRGASVVEFRDGRIARCCDYWDFAALMRHFGQTGSS